VAHEPLSLGAPLTVVICDMWDAHYCQSAARRAAELAPRANQVVAALRAALRDRGASVVHAPGGCMAFYLDGTAPAAERGR
jgi:hypothetical protein